MLRAENLGETTVEYFDARGTVSDRPLDFFLERYADAYRAEIERFSAVRKGEDANAGGRARRPPGVGARRGGYAIVTGRRSR